MCIKRFLSGVKKEDRTHSQHTHIGDIFVKRTHFFKHTNERDFKKSRLSP